MTKGVLPMVEVCAHKKPCLEIFCVNGALVGISISILQFYLASNHCHYARSSSLFMVLHLNTQS